MREDRRPGSVRRVCAVDPRVRSCHAAHMSAVGGPWCGLPRWRPVGPHGGWRTATALGGSCRMRSQVGALGISMHVLVIYLSHHSQINHCRGGGAPRVCSSSCDLDVPAGPLAAQKGTTCPSRTRHQLARGTWISSRIQWRPLAPTRTRLTRARGATSTP